MPYPLRSFTPGGVYQLTARGTNDEALLRCSLDGPDFVALLSRVASRFTLDVLAWCLMTTHYHLLVRTRSGDVSHAMQYLNREYARRFNLRHGRYGHLFLARFRTTVVSDDEHLWNTYAYVLDNPVRAGVAARSEDWPWCGAAPVAAVLGRS